MVTDAVWNDPLLLPCAGPFEKFIRVTMILPLTGPEYSNKVSEHCVAYWKAIGIYTDAEADAVEKVKAAFKEETFPPGSSILFTQSPSGTLTVSIRRRCGNIIKLHPLLSLPCFSRVPIMALTALGRLRSSCCCNGTAQIAFSKDGGVPESAKAVIENKAMSEAILQSIIGEHGVSPEAKRSLASRVSQLLGEHNPADTVQPQQEEVQKKEDQPEEVKTGIN